MRSVYFLRLRKEPGAGKRSKVKAMQWEIGKLTLNFNCSDLLFAHACCCCDTTSA